MFTYAAPSSLFSYTAIRHRFTHLRAGGVHCRESAGIRPHSKSQGILDINSKRVLPLQVTMDQLICFLENYECIYTLGVSTKRENVKTLRWDHSLQRQNIFMAFKRIPVTLDQQYDVGEKPTVILYTNNTTIHCEL